MSPLGAVCVYCASSEAVVARYGAAARQVGRRLAERGVRVVYGGGRVGLMGQVADGALEMGGEVVGVIPERLYALEVGHEGCTRLEVVPTMHDRKARMAELADAFVALPGGWGTWEELLEVVTWTQLGYHRKPVGVLDVDGYYAGLRALLERAVGEGFVRPEVAGILSFHTEVDGLLDALAAAELPEVERWLVEP
ncbi:MAG: TIGR00730 family Rossman fold protein [Alphaproteobacteria bacterium]|nr:TIGR00730 family Rossman fold protein [Alphaproteobacteria bacterium]